MGSKGSPDPQSSLRASLIKFFLSYFHCPVSYLHHHILCLCILFPLATQIHGLLSGSSVQTLRRFAGFVEEEEGT